MIFFDIDGTLIDHATASAAASLRLFDHFTNEIPFPREEFPTVWETALMRHFNRFCRGEISIWEQRRARIRDVFSNPALDDDEADKRYRVFIKYYESLTQPFDDAAVALAQLAGKWLGITSNGARDQQIRKLERAGLLKHFSVMVFSEDVGLGKPAPAIFLKACRLAGDDPADCIHIGDDFTCDIEASQAFGLTPIWLDRSGAGQSRSGVTRITSLSALSSVLESNFALCTPSLASASSVVNRF
jgi:putative hydrolase of the HAD superfamily